MGGQRGRGASEDDQEDRALTHSLSAEAELRAALEVLFGDCRRWKLGEIDSFELSDRIHHVSGTFCKGMIRTHKVTRVRKNHLDGVQLDGAVEKSWGCVYFKW